MTGLTVTSDSEIKISARQNPVTESKFSPLFGVGEVVDSEDVQVVVLAEKQRSKKVKGKKKAIDQCILSREVKRNPIPRRGGDEGVGLYRGKVGES